MSNKRIKVIETDQSGRVKLTLADLQRLLDEAYDNGYSDGRDSKDWTYYPSYQPYTTNDLKITTTPNIVYSNLCKDNTVYLDKSYQINCNDMTVSAIKLDSGWEDLTCQSST